MLKKLSAALILASMLAGPAMAAGLAQDQASGKTAVKTETAAPAIKPVAAADSKPQAKPALLNAKAQLPHRHHREVRRHHRFHKVGMHKTFRHTAHRATVAHVKRG